MRCLLAVIALVASTAATEPETISGPIKMKPSEIRAYNAKLRKDHPNYIKCARVEETGSLVKRTTVCRTNEEWTRIEARGNDDARDTVDGLRKGWTNGG